MSDGGKGSSPRPFSISQEEYAANWERVFGKYIQSVEDDTVDPNRPSDYQDILSTEECVLDALDQLDELTKRVSKNTQG